MPAALPLAGSLFSIGSVGAATGWTFAGLTLAQGLSLAGGVVGLMGGLTGNKKLARIGGVLGLAGMGASLASSANAASAANPAAAGAAEAGVTTTANVGGNLAQGADAAGASLADTAAAASSQASQAMSGASDALGAANGSWDVLPAQGAIASPVADVRNAISSTNVSDMVAASRGSPGILSGAMESSNYGLYGEPPMGAAGAQPSVSGAPVAGGPMSFWDRLGQTAEKVGAWAEKNPGTAKMALGAAAVGGKYMADMAAQEDKIKREEWLRQRYNDSLRNLRIPGLVRNPNAIIANATRG